MTKREVSDRSKIDVDDPLQAKCWSHQLGISKERLTELVERVGNSAAAVRKELETDGQQARPADA